MIPMRVTATMSIMANVGAKGKPDARATSDRWVAANDWASPGKQTTPPFSTAAAAILLRRRSSHAAGKYGPAERPCPTRHSDFNDICRTGPDRQLRRQWARIQTLNGLYNSLVISVGVVFTDTLGRQLLCCRLGWQTATETNFAWANAPASPTIGVQMVPLSFDGQIQSTVMKLNGPYPTVGCGAARGGVAFGPARSPPYYRGAYRYTDFERVAALFAGSAHEKAIDTDNRRLLQPPEPGRGP